MFDWRLFFDRRGIEYIEGGKVGPGNLGIRCPWCVNPTHLDHLGVGPNGYYCWKGGKAHSGVVPQKLIISLLHCTPETADRIVESESTSYATDDDSFGEESMRRLGIVLQQPERPDRGTLKMLPEFSSLSTGMARRLALPYLRNRGYDADDAMLLADRYGLRFAASGPFSYRIVVPIMWNGALVNWTARTIAASEDLRYKSLSTDSEKAAKQQLPVATMSIKDTLLDWDQIRRGGQVLVLSEGPFDALRVGFLGERLGVRATCLFGKAASPAQIGLIAEIASRYERVVALFDRDAAFEAFTSLPDYLGVEELELPSRVKDPAELTPSKFRELFDGLL